MVRQAGVLSAATYLDQLVAMIRGLLVAWFLGPSLYGVWNLFKTYLQGAIYAGLGASWALPRELPFNSGQDPEQSNERKNQLLKQTTLSFSLGIAVVVTVLTLAYSFFDAAEGLRTEIRLAALAFILNVVHVYIPHQFRGELKIYQLARYVVLYGLLNSIFGVVLMGFYGISGLLMGMIITSSLLIFALIRSKELTFTYRINKDVLKGAIIVGFPMMFVSIAPRLMASLDKVIIFVMIGSSAAGYYSLAAFFSNFVDKIPVAIAAVLLPRLMLQKGKGVELGEMSHYFHKPMVLQALVVPIVLGLMVLNVESVLLLFLPDYLPAVPPLQVLVMGLYFSAIWNIPKGVLIVANKQHIFMIAVPLFLSLGVLMNIAVIRMGYGMVGVAYASVLFYFLVALTTIIYALKLLDRSRTDAVKAILSIFLPYFYAVIVVIVVGRFELSSSIIVNSLLISVLFLAGCTPLLLWADKELQILATFRNVLAK